MRRHGPHAIVRRAAAAMMVATAACSPPFRECPPVDPSVLQVVPDRLSGTGLFADLATETLGDGVRRFAPRFELWSDAAVKRRWIYLPPGARIDTTDPDAWNFPIGTKLWKEFTRDGVRVETRLLWKHGTEQGAWTALAYVWDGDDAWPLPDGVVDARGTSHDVPSAPQCIGCHGGTRSGVLGFSAIQLPPTSSDGVSLETLTAAGLLTSPVTPPTIPGDATTQQALGYLHANCSHCHNQRRPERTGPRCFDPERELDFMLRTDELASPESTATYRTAIGEVIERGDPEDSDVIRRIRSRDRWWGMPALGTEVVDRAGMATLEAWIRAL